MHAINTNIIISDESGSRHKKQKQKKNRIIESDEDEDEEESGRPPPVVRRRKKSRSKYEDDSDFELSGDDRKKKKDSSSRSGRGSRPFPKRTTVQRTPILDASDSDDPVDPDDSDDADYSEGDSDNPKKPKHRGKPAWATKPIPKGKRPEYAVDRPINGITSASKDPSLPSNTVNCNNSNNSSITTSNDSSDVTAPSQKATVTSKIEEALPPVGSNGEEDDLEGDLPVSEEDIASLGVDNVDDLVNYVTQDDV